MSDIRLIYGDTFADLVTAANDLETDDGLETAVIISLFTDRRAADDDELPIGETRRRGFWGDAVADVDGDRIGSRLWLLSREKQLQTVVDRAVEYAREALAWLIEDKIANKVEVSGEIVRTGVLGLQILIDRPGTGNEEYRYNYEWAAQEARRA